MASSQGDRLMSNRKCKLPEAPTEKATAMLSVPGSESYLRDCGNQLTVLSDYQSFSLITKFLKNHNSVPRSLEVMRTNESAARPRRQAMLWMSMRSSRRNKRTDDSRTRLNRAAGTNPGPQEHGVQPGRPSDVEQEVQAPGGFTTPTGEANRCACALKAWLRIFSS